MDVDTIFPAVSVGEQILGKYQDSIFLGRLQMVVIITNLRLLIQRKFTSCGFFSPSYHSSINLRSIHRIDDTSSSPSWALVLPLLIVFFSGVTVFLVGSMVDRLDIFFIVFGIILIILSIVGFVLLFILNKCRYIQVQGTFGTTILKFPEDTGREIDGRLSEMIYQRKMQQTSSQRSTYGNQQQPSNNPTQALYSNIQ
jgi:succinate dehydrogenase hydrophobic anchor subunit